MDRRDFFKSTTALIATSTIGKNLLALAPESAAPGTRIVMPLNRDWRFSSKLPEGFEGGGFTWGITFTG